MFRAKAGSEIKALKAVLDPMLMMARRMRHVPMRIRALSGNFNEGWTFTKRVEKGRPLSRENAQARRETDAKTLKKDIKIMMPSITIKRLVTGLEPVAW